MRVSKGICYWLTYDAAREAAQLALWPWDRIIAYRLGWAVQLRISGPYMGPHGEQA